MPIPDDVTAEELDRDVRRELSGLGSLAGLVGRQLVMVARLLDDEPELALKYAQAARRLGSRLACVREAVGLAAYRAGDYTQALAELRTVRRMTGSQAYLPILADCERGLGRPEKALEYLGLPEVKELDDEGRIELLIVASGARRDLGDPHAALITLQTPFLKRREPAEAVARLQVAYATALEDNGRGEESRAWLERAAQLDPTGASGAAELLADLDGLVFVDLEDEDLNGEDLDHGVEDDFEDEDGLEETDDELDGDEIDDDAEDEDDQAPAEPQETSSAQASAPGGLFLAPPAAEEEPES